jgi:glycine/D-amino acid oxidase-like deaminating enzyme
MKEIPFWLDQPYNPRPQLKENIETDVLIIGGGITGVSAAYHCAKLGLKTVLIEKDSIASGSAGKNGGMIVEGFSCDFIEACERFDEGTAVKMWNKTVEAAALTKSLIREHSIPCDLTEEGSLYVGLSDEESIWLKNEVSARIRNGIKAEILSRDKITSPSFTDILFNPMDGGIHPVNFVRGLATASEKLGVTIYEDTPAVSWTNTGALTPLGQVQAQKVVLALESSTPDMGSSSKTYDSVGVMTEPISANTMSKIFNTGEMLWTTGKDYICVRKYKDRLFLNGEEVDSLMQTFFKYFPNISKEEVPISHVWHGLMTYPKNLAPIIDKIDGVFRVYGQGGNGLTNGIVSGRDVALLLKEDKALPLTISNF